MFNFTFSEKCEIVNPLLAPLSLAANFIEEKYRTNPYISTLCKVAQSVPLANLASEKVFDMGIRSLVQVGTLENGRKIWSMPGPEEDSKFLLDMSEKVLIGLILLPILNAALKKLAGHYENPRLKSIINGFDKFYMIAVKTTNLAIITLGLFESLKKIPSIGAINGVAGVAAGVLYISAISLSLLWNVSLSYQTLTKKQS